MPDANGNGNVRKTDKDLYELLDQLQATIEQAKGVPFSDNCLVDRADALYWIRQIRASFPSEVEQAKWIVDQQRQVVASAKQKAESILRESEQRQAIMVDEHQVTMLAKEQSEKILTEANQQSEQIYARSIEYARKKLTEIENELTDMLVRIQKDKKELK
ncbi:MAG: hypothetical protein J6Y08_11085 [Clostridiales bacterium]|nr:hypothetical protein [Clostridiales bacterium]